MPVPSFFGQARDLAPPAFIEALSSLPMGGAGAGSAKLPFTMQQQEMENWCWAATSTSVSHFYDSSSAWTQCAVATDCLAPERCCDAPRPCDVQHRLDLALQTTANLRGMVDSDIPFADLSAEIDGGAPVCCHIKWPGVGGHFVAVVGYDSANEDVDIADPYYGPSTIPLSTLLSAYHGTGRWGYSYLTRA